MNRLHFLFSQQGSANPVLVFDGVPKPDISCTRVTAGAYDFVGSDIIDPKKCRLFISPMECENQDTGEPVVASMSNQGPLKVIGRDASGSLCDFNMADEVSIPMVLHVYP
jgi:hypothetical protein